MVQDADRLIRDLGDEDYDVREAATAALREMAPERAAPILERAIQSRDPEVRARARAMLPRPAEFRSFEEFYDPDLIGRSISIRRIVAFQVPRRPGETDDAGDWERVGTTN